MANVPSAPGSRGSSPAAADRPAIDVWRSLEAESICWEGQVLIVGSGQDLPALLVVTRARLVFIVNRQIALEAPREWLRPAPRLTAENGVEVVITPDGESGQPMLLRARDGRGAAAGLVAVLTGRPLPMQPSASGMQIPRWQDSVGASVAVALPPLEDEDPELPQQGGRASWPPVEQEGVAVTPPPRKQGRPMQQRADQHRGTSVAAWAASNMPEPSPVPPEVSRAARKQGTKPDGFTVADENDAPSWKSGPQQGPRRGHQIAAWTLRAAIMLVVLGTIGYFGRERLVVSMDEVRDRIPADIQRSLGITDREKPDEMALNGVPDTSGNQSDGTNGASVAGQPVEEPTKAPVQTEIAQVEPSEVPVEQKDPTANMGGTTTELPPTSNAQDLVTDPTAIPTEEPVVPTEIPVEPTEIPVEPTAEPTEIPIEPTAEPTEIPIEPTAEPTEVPVEPTVVPTEVPVESTSEPTAVPTGESTQTPIEDAIVMPTDQPVDIATVEPTQVPAEGPTAVPDEDPTADQQPTIEPQQPSVLPETTPEQSFVSEGFRYTVEGASIGATVPDLPQINSVGDYGEWVVLSVYGQNMTNDIQVFDMAEFRLFADGQEILVDVGNAWVSGLVGNSPAYGNTDAIQWAPGEAHRFTLTFLAPPAAESLVLQAGEQTIDLGPVLADPPPLLGDGEMPVESDLLQGTVVEVVDGETIVVELDGVQQTIRYLGMDAPTGDACYATEAAEANRSLVSGQTVTIERQSTNTDARGAWVRDVWVTNDTGQPVLVSQQLVMAGAAEADITVPNTRFQGWLESSEMLAQRSEAGIWGSCEE